MYHLIPSFAESTRFERGVQIDRSAFFLLFFFRALTELFLPLLSSPLLSPPMREKKKEKEEIEHP